MNVDANIDRLAIGSSTACIIHCLALPVLAVSLPVFASLAQAEWIHWLFTALAIVASGSVIAFAHGARRPMFVVPAIAGIFLLATALGADSFGLDETLLTVAGGLILAGAHTLRLLRYR